MKKSGMNFLRRKLSLYKMGVEKRYRYYAMQDIDNTMSIVMPYNVKSAYRSVLEWTTKGVDALADRIVFREFGNDDFNATEIFNANNPDIFFDTAIQSALIGSCAFVYISRDGDNLPRLQVIEASKATGILDPTTFLLTEGYAVLETDQNDNPILEAYFTPTETWYYPKNSDPYSIPNPTNQPLLVPIIHRPDAVRPFGRSRITRSGMYQQKAAKRTLERAEATAEFYSFPQKYVLGTSQDAEALDKWKATVSTVLEITKDDDGDKPVVGQFASASMEPFFSQLKMYASLFAGGSGLTLDDLGFPSDNPSSVEAIKASHENLRASAKKAQRSFASGLLNVAYVAVCLRDNQPYERTMFMNTKIVWGPLFEIDGASLSTIGDGLIKISQAYPELNIGEVLFQTTGIKGEDSPIIASAITKAMPITDQKTNKNVSEQTLNGAQTQSLIAIMGQFTSGSITEGQAVNLISTAIGLNKEEARKILLGVI